VAVPDRHSHLKLSNGLSCGDIWFYHPDDLKRLYETAVQLWTQGDAIQDSTVIERPQFLDAAGAAIQPLQPNVGGNRQCPAQMNYAERGDLARRALSG